MEYQIIETKNLEGLANIKLGDWMTKDGYVTGFSSGTAKGKNPLKIYQIK